MKSIQGDVYSCEFNVIILLSIKESWLTGQSREVAADLWPGMNGKLRLGDFLPKKQGEKMVYGFVCVDEGQEFQDIIGIMKNCLANPGLAAPAVYAIKMAIPLPDQALISRIFSLLEKTSEYRALRFVILLSEEEMKKAKELEAKKS